MSRPKLFNLINSREKESCRPTNQPVNRNVGFPPQKIHRLDNFFEWMKAGARSSGWDLRHFPLDEHLAHSLTAQRQATDWFNFFFRSHSKLLTLNHFLFHREPFFPKMAPFDQFKFNESLKFNQMSSSSQVERVFNFMNLNHFQKIKFNFKKWNFATAAAPGKKGGKFETYSPLCVSFQFVQLGEPSENSVAT